MYYNDVKGRHVVLMLYTGDSLAITILQKACVFLAGV